MMEHASINFHSLFSYLYIVLMVKITRRPLLIFFLNGFIIRSFVISWLTKNFLKVIINNKIRTHHVIYMGLILPGSDFPEKIPGFWSDPTWYNSQLDFLFWYFLSTFLEKYKYFIYHLLLFQVLFIKFEKISFDIKRILDLDIQSKIVSSARVWAGETEYNYPEKKTISALNWTRERNAIKCKRKIPNRNE